MNKFQRFYIFWPMSFIELAESLICIVTLGQVRLDWSINYMCWRAKRMKKKVKTGDNNNV